MPEATKQEMHPRAVRSFVRRAGRITASQKNALRELWPVYGIDYDTTELNLATVFGREAPCTMEIGYGDGETLVAQANAHPDQNFLGVEIYAPGVGHMLISIKRETLSNVRLIREDAVDVLTYQITLASLDSVNLFFPDPWPKKKHHKRRIVQPGFARLVASRLKPGGRFHLATDWVPYAEHMLEVLSSCEYLDNCSASNNYIERPDTRPQSKFEQRGQKLGHEVRDLMFVRNENPL